MRGFGNHILYIVAQTMIYGLSMLLYSTVFFAVVGNGQSWQAIPIYAIYLAYLLSPFFILDVILKIIFYPKIFSIPFIALETFLLLLNECVIRMQWTIGKRLNYNTANASQVILETLMISLIYILSSFLLARGMSHVGFKASR